MFIHQINNYSIVPSSTHHWSNRIVALHKDTGIHHGPADSRPARDLEILRGIFSAPDRHLVQIKAIWEGLSLRETINNWFTSTVKPLPLDTLYLWKLEVFGIQMKKYPFLVSIGRSKNLPLFRENFRFLA